MMTLVTFIFFDLRDAVTVTLLRIMLGSIVGGTFLSPTFFLSLSGGVTSAFVMSWVYFSGKSPFSFVGVSICAAYTHTLTTVICVYFSGFSRNSSSSVYQSFLCSHLLRAFLQGSLEILSLKN